MAVTFNGLTVTPNASGAAFHETQTRTYWGRWATDTALPNASGNALVRQAFTALKPGDFAFVSGTETLHVCVSKGTDGGADAVWRALAHGSRIESDPGAALTLANAHDGGVFRCAASGGCAVTIPTGLRSGLAAHFIAAHAADPITFVGGAGMSLRYLSIFAPATRQQWASVTVRILSTSEAHLTGVLADV